MLSISAFSIDIILPAFPGLSDGLGVSTKHIQFIIPMYLFAMGLAHPVFGALTDRYGRKPCIYLGLCIFLLGSVVCLFSTSLSMLLAGRFLQGFGAATGNVVCRAMIRDRFSGSELAQNMAIVSMFFAVGPVLAPLIGFVLYSSVGWQGIFMFLIVFALGLAFATHLQQETLPAEQRRSSGWRNMVADFIYIYQHRQSRYFVLMGICCTSLIVTFLEHAQVLYAQLGTGSGRFAVLFALSSAGIIVGQIINHRLIRRFGAIGAARFATVVVALTSLLIMLAVLSNTLTDRLMTILMLAFHTSFLIIFSNVISLTLDPHRERAGAAAAAFGFAGYMTGSVIAALVTVVADEKLSRWSVCFFLITVVIAVAAWRWRSPVSENAA